jgi:hypothetical protein
MIWKNLNKKYAFLLTSGFSIEGSQHPSPVPSPAAPSPTPLPATSSPVAPPAVGPSGEYRPPMFFAKLIWSV